MNGATGPSGSYSVFNAMIDIIASPAQALAEVKRRPNWFWWPLAVLLGLTCAAFVYYFNWVDFEWLVDNTVRQAILDGAPADDAEAIRGFMSPTGSMVVTLVAVVVMTLLIYALQAAYLHIVNRTVGDPAIGYGQWFSFSVWTAFVGVFSAIAMFVVILTADNNQVAQYGLAPLSINALFLDQQPGDPWFTWGNSLSLVNFWMLYLMTLGFARWTGASMAKAAAVAITPWALIFGIWGIVIAL